MSNQDNSSVTFTQIVERVKRNKVTLFICVILPLLIALSYNYYTRPIYKASAVVAFENFSKDDMLDFNFSSFNFQTNFVANRLRELKAKSFAKNVYEELTAPIRGYFQLPDNLPSHIDSKEYIIRKIQDNITVSQGGTPNIINISFDSENPKLATIVANTIIDVLQKNNVKFRRQEFSSLRKFLDEQIKVVEKKLKNAEAALRDFKTKTNITSLDDESREILHRITQAEVLRNQVQTDRDARQKRLSVIQKKFAEQKETTVASLAKTSTPLIKRLKEKLIDIQVQYTTLRVQNYPEDHSKVQALKSAIDNAKENLMSETLSILQDKTNNSILDPITQLEKYLQESISLEIELAALNARAAHIRTILNSYSDRLKKLPGNEAVLFKLTRDREVHSDNYFRLFEERERARVREEAEIGYIHVMDPAEEPFIPYKPRKLVNITIAIFLGAVTGLLLILLKESLKAAPRTPEEVEAMLNLPVLCSIPKVKKRQLYLFNDYLGENSAIFANQSMAKHPFFANQSITKHPLLRGGNSASTNGNFDPLYREAYSYLWSHIQVRWPNKINAVMITSARPHEGKSTMAINLALTAARLGKKTVLIDGDFHNPGIHEVFEISSTPGLSNLVLDSVEIDQAVVDENTSSYDRVKQSDGGSWNRGHNGFYEKSPYLKNSVLSSEKLQILTAGDKINQPDLLWTSRALEETLKYLRGRVDFIVIDAPPLLGISDPINIATNVDGILLCVEAEQTPKNILLRAKKCFDHTSAKLLGVVLNKVEPVSIYGKTKYRKYY
ncbi:MAG: hypothetical protein E2O29_02485 [Deltaproteobacteria bacterium]|nr:MAG: hypothetical protein E2O29_02485 [Deltaproteobacteria bacterium]